MTDTYTDPVTGTPVDDEQLDQMMDAMQAAIDSRPVVLAVVLDRSGSMESVRDATISGFNEWKGNQLREPGDALLSLTLFDTEFEALHQLVPLAQVPDLDRSTYAPRGMTALYDGIGHTVASIDKAIAGMDPAPARVVFVIMTDGGENSSKEHTREQINELLETKQKQAELPWDVVFLGANQDAFAEGSKVGVSRDSTANYAGTASGTASAFAAMSTYSSRSRKLASSRMKGSNKMSKAERDRLAGS